MAADLGPGLGDELSPVTPAGADLEGPGVLSRWWLLGWLLPLAVQTAHTYWPAQAG